MKCNTSNVIEVMLSITILVYSKPNKLRMIKFNHLSRIYKLLLLMISFDLLTPYETKSQN